MKVTKETWAAWHTSGAASRWTEADADAARRLIRLVDDRNRADDARERRLLEEACRRGEARLRLGQLGVTADDESTEARAVAFEPWEGLPERAELTGLVLRLADVDFHDVSEEWWLRVEALTHNERIALAHTLREGERWRQFVPSVHPERDGRWNLLPGASKVLARIDDGMWALEE